jgi:leucine dehydrogenase
VSLSEAAEFDGHEEVAFLADQPTRLRAILAVHDTTLGPALGGCRMLPYPSSTQALQDALRLSQAMGYKAACAGIPFGGGKCVVLGDPRPDQRPGLLQALGARLARLDGRFFLGEDVGTSPQDMAIIHRTAPNVVGLPTELGGSGDPSAWTARGCLAGMRAAATEALGVDSLAGIRVAIQGIGKVGGRLCQALGAEGAILIVTDLRPELTRAAAALGASTVTPQEIYDADADLFAPCALGGTLSAATVERLKVRIVAGCANNQLQHPGVGAALGDRGVLYAPDYVINAGGMIRLAAELLNWDHGQLQQTIDNIAVTLGRTFALARTHGVPTSEAADRLAADRLHRSGSTNPGGGQAHRRADDSSVQPSPGPGAGPPPPEATRPQGPAVRRQ